ncbi:MAG: cytochrome c-type biogenesis protein CcmH [Hyphomicrobiales bacterium]|nr:cytochrome c-type biogenesis protein CcmH [Hyphomicrobiales bacterium]
MRIWAVLAILLTLFAVPAAAVEPDEVLADPKLEQRARDLSAQLRCMVCQNQTIDDSNAPLARDLRILVRERLTAGDSDGEVIKFLVDRYGEFVLLKPSFTDHNLILWLAPFAVLIVGAGTLWGVFRRRALKVGSESVDRLSEGERKRLKSLISDS